MDFDVKKTLDGFGKSIENTIDSSTDMTQEAGDKIHKGVKTFDKEFVSKITPDMGKYGNFAKFGAEMVPGVSSYNSIKEGDWTGAAVAAGIDLTAIGVGVMTGGAGAVAVKAGGKVVVKEGTKLAIKKGTKELVESGAKKVIKEVVAEEGVKKATKEIAEVSTEKVSKEVLEGATEKVVKDAIESGTKKVSKESIEDIAKKESIEITVPTINQHLLDNVHPETGVKYVWKIFRDADGILKKAVVPDFKSAFDNVLPKELYIATHKQQVEWLNKSLKAAYAKVPENFSQFSKDQIDEIMAGKTPSGFTWHHDLPNGHMKLVDSVIHDKTRHTGGMSLWGIGHR